MGEHIRLEAVWYNAPAVGKNGSSFIDPLTASRIDEGGYATTYRVPVQPGLPVGGILKVFKHFPEPYRAGERLRRKAKWGALYDEYDMLCALDGLDGHVPQAYACGFLVIDDGAGGVTYSPAFLMEEVDSPAERLDKVLQKHREPFGADQVATFGLRMLDVLDLLAEQGKGKKRGIAHADLSSWNVYVRRSSDDGVFDWVYLIDFGQSKYADEDVTPSFAPGVHPRMGMVEYCAPESIPKFALRERDSEACREHDELYDLRNDPEVDLWSLGALMYQLALRKAPRYSVQYAKRGDVSGFWRGEVKLDDDDAFRALIEEKRDSLSLPDYMNEERELLLGQAIALCTAWDPRDRDRLHIRRLLTRVAEGTDDERFQQMTYVPEVTPTLEDGGGSEQGARVESGVVLAGVYKLTGPDGTPFSDAEADLLVFGDSKQTVDIREYRYRGVTYAAEHVGPCYDMSCGGWGVKEWQSDSPWQSIKIVDFLTKVRPARMRAWFAGCKNLTELLHIDRLDTSAVTDMQFMFHDCSSLEYVDVFGFDTSQVERMNAMFHGCAALQGINVGGFDTSKVISMASMFDGCSALVVLDVGRFKTDRVQSFDSMFNDCSSLRRLDVSHFETGAATSLAAMFRYCRSLETIDVSGFDTSAATALNHMFCGCGKLAVLDVSGFRTPHVESFKSMFCRCSSLRELDVSGFDCSSATDLSFMFKDCPELGSIGDALRSVRDDADTGNMYTGCPKLACPGSVWAAMYKLCRADGSAYSGREMDLLVFGQSERGCALNRYSVDDEHLDAVRVGEPIDMSSKGWDVKGGESDCPWQDVETVLFTGRVAPRNMCAWFARCARLKSVVGIERLDTSRTTDMQFAFYRCESLERLDVSGFDTSKVTTFTSMFKGCASLLELDVSGFRTPHAESFMSMFNGCSSLWKLDVSHFDTSRAASFNCMFADCHALAFLDVSRFDTSRVTNMRHMFFNDGNLRQLDVSRFDTRRVEDFTCMFHGCSSLAAVDVSGFRTPHVESFRSMFNGCSSLAALDVSGFDTASATDMGWMFHGCSSLAALDVSHFDTSTVEHFERMFDECSALASLDVSHFDTSRAASFNCMFADCHALAFLDVSRFDTSRVTNMRHMFFNDGNLRQLDVSRFDTRRVEDFTCMFAGCSSLRSLDVSGFDTSSASDMSWMFADCTSLANLKGWPFSIPEGTDLALMFEDCPFFEVVDRSYADTAVDADSYANVGRNDPCPCGSGKKFKICHGRNR